MKNKVAFSLFVNSNNIFCIQTRFLSSISNKPKGYWENNENIKIFLDKLSVHLNLTTMEDWNSLTQKHIYLHGGGSLLKNYSMYELKSIGFPEGKEIYSKPKNETGYWKDEKNVKKFLNEISEIYNIKTKEDWNSLTQKQIYVNGGGSLLKNYSMYELKCIGFPEGKEIYSKPKTQVGYWRDEKNVKKFLFELQENLNLTTSKDWNSITRKHIYLQEGGRNLLKNYSMYELKSIGFPEGKEIYSKPKMNKKWINKEDIDDFLQKLKEKLNLQTFDDWNSITTKIIKDNDGGSLFNNYSLYEIKCLGCKDVQNNINKKSRKTFGFWNKKDNIQNFLNELKDVYNLKSPSDWNLLSQNQIKNIGGRSILKHFSMFEIKSMGCPEGKFIFSKPNTKKSLKYWEKEENVLQFLKILQRNLNLNLLNDWNRISNSQIIKFGGKGLLSLYSKDELIQKFISDKNLQESFPSNKKSSQRLLFLYIQQLFPDDEIVEDYFHSEISRFTGFPVQFDVFLVKKNIAFEYHGEQHYTDIPSLFAPVEMYKKRDKEKQILCSKFGIQLIIIPFWWDNNIDSLKETVINYKL